MLGVIGLVIGGIWVATAAMRENMTANKIAEGSSFYFQAASNLVRRNGGSTALNANLADRAGLMPKDLIINAASGTFGYGSVTFGLGGTAIIGTKEGIGLSFSFPLNQSGLCRKIIIKLTQQIWRQVMSIRGGAMLGSYPFGGSAAVPTTLTGPVGPTNSGLSVCDTDAFGLGTSMFLVFYDING